MSTKRALLLGLGLLGSVWAAGVADVLACGDKLVVVGRGLRPKRMKGSVPASILLYADPKGSLPAALEEGHLRQDLEKAGHRLRSVSSREELDAALDTGTYDLVFADFKAAPASRRKPRPRPRSPRCFPRCSTPQTPSWRPPPSSTSAS